MKGFIFQDFRRGNTINIVFAGTATLLWIVLKSHYKFRNARNARRLAKMTDVQRKEEDSDDDCLIVRQYVRKVVLSTEPTEDGCVVVAWLYNSPNWEVAFCRIGDHDTLLTMSILTILILDNPNF